MSVIDTIREAGIIGAGGAGFPTHVKMNCKGKAEVIIANGAECEPLLRVDQQIMALYADDLVRAMLAVKEELGAKKAVICLKAHYHDAVSALLKATEGKEGIEVRQFDSYYPAGDEQQMVYEVTGKVVPTGGLPLDVGAVVSNVSTFVNIARAMDGKPVTDKYVTVGGEVKNPVTLRVPIGTPIRVLIEAAGGPKDLNGYTVILGGPCMGKLCSDIETPVTKTTGGILIFKNTHPLVAKKTGNLERDLKLARAVCCQCSMCTQMCPRNALGLNVQPHKAMRAAAQGNGKLLGELNGIFSCCDCGVCSYYACTFGLSPSRMMQRMKAGLQAEGIRPKKEVFGTVDPGREGKRVPVARLIQRLKISAYDVPAPLNDNLMEVQKVRIPLKMHIGAPAVPTVVEGAMVSAGDLIAEIKEGALGARVHASISGRVTKVSEQAIEIEA